MYSESFRNPLTLSIVPINSSMMATIVADSDEDEAKPMQLDDIEQKIIEVAIFIIRKEETDF